MTIAYQRATRRDAPMLAELNRQLIHDEGHRNTMSLPQLQSRMEDWLAGDYDGIIFQRASDPVGYALFRQEPEYIYLRQFFVSAAYRRRGIGRAALDWLRQHEWRGAERIRLDVLVGNPAAINFWRAVGFADYCLTMELDLTPS